MTTLILSSSVKTNKCYIHILKYPVFQCRLRIKEYSGSRKTYEFCLEATWQSGSVSAWGSKGPDFVQLVIVRGDCSHEIPRLLVGAV